MQMSRRKFLAGASSLPAAAVSMAGVQFSDAKKYKYMIPTYLEQLKRENNLKHTLLYYGFDPQKMEHCYRELGKKLKWPEPLLAKRLAGLKVQPTTTTVILAPPETIGTRTEIPLFVGKYMVDIAQQEDDFLSHVIDWCYQYITDTYTGLQAEDIRIDYTNADSINESVLTDIRMARAYDNQFNVIADLRRKCTSEMSLGYLANYYRIVKRLEQAKTGFFEDRAARAFLSRIRAYPVSPRAFMR